ncbi:MAG: hypothetical protein ACXWJB_01745, partial [Limisphaerales bacterium]
MFAVAILNGSFARCAEVFQKIYAQRSRLGKTLTLTSSTPELVFPRVLVNLPIKYTTSMISLRVALVGGFLMAACAYAQNDKLDEAVQREIVRLNAVKPRPPLRPLNNVSMSYQL